MATTPSGVRIDDLEKVVKAFRDKQMEAREDNRWNLVVGFSAWYAIYVHERLDVHHPIGQAKFLEVAIRTGAGRMGKIVREVLKVSKNNRMATALRAAGNWLLVRAIALCPVDTGRLRESGFVKLQKK